MKNAIIISLLFGTAHINCIERSNLDKMAQMLALPAIALFMAINYLYEYHIKDPNVRLKEKFDEEQKSFNHNLSIGMMLSQQRRDDLQQLQTHLSNQTDLSPEDAGLKQYVGQQLNHN
jgi:hypothetical protein